MPPSTTEMVVERLGAWTLVVLIHVVVAWIATRPSPPAEPGALPMTLVFIERPPPAGTKSSQAKASPMPSEHRDAAPPQSQPRPTRPQTPVVHRAARTTLQATTANDRWDAPAPVNHGEPGTFANANPMHRFNPIQMGPPERFRMYKQLSPADIVRIISMGLFWPPGYTDDVCPGLDKAVQMLTGASTRREQEILVDAVKQQQRYCS